MSNETNKKTGSLFGKIVYGGAAGLIGATLIMPLDTIKTRLMATTGQKMSPSGVVLQIVRKEGLLAFYTGLRPYLIGVVPEKALKLVVNDTAREYFTASNGGGSITLAQEIASGALAGFCQVVATAPMERTKIQMQINEQKQRKVPLTQVVKELGLRGCYRGTVATWARDVPFSLLYFPLYANVERYLSSKTDQRFTAVLVSAMGAGAVAAFLSTPMDVIKTRVQAQRSTDMSAPVLRWVPTALRTVREEGPAALFRGALPRVFVIAPLFGVALSVYEFKSAMESQGYVI